MIHSNYLVISLPLALAMSLGACGDDSSSTDSGDPPRDGGAAAVDSGDPPRDGAAAPVDSGGTTPGGGRFDSCEHDAPVAVGDGDVGSLAAGLSVLAVEANQGLGVAVAQGGVVVSTDSHEVPLITDRPTLFRARWQREASFTPGEIEGRLIIRTGGQEYVFRETRTVDADSNWSEQFFSWIVPRCLVQADMSWAVGFFDPSGGGAGDARIPASDTAALDPWPDPMELKVVFVPIVPTRGDSDELCTTMERVDEQLTFMTERFEDLRAYLTSMFPVQNVEMVMHERVRVSWGTECNSDGPTKDRIIELRNDEAPGDNWYYQGVVPFDPGWSGASIFWGEGRDQNRTSWAEAWDYLPILSAHELIHSHAVPHVSGSIELWGWGPYGGPYPWPDRPRLETLKDPANWTRIMKPAAGGRMWIGPDTYRSVAERIRILTAWDYE